MGLVGDCQAASNGHIRALQTKPIKPRSRSQSCLRPPPPPTDGVGFKRARGDVKSSKTSPSYPIKTRCKPRSHHALIVSSHQNTGTVGRLSNPLCSRRRRLRWHLSGGACTQATILSRAAPPTSAPALTNFPTTHAATALSILIRQCPTLLIFALRLPTPSLGPVPTLMPHSVHPVQPQLARRDGDGARGVPGAWCGQPHAHPARQGAIQGGGGSGGRAAVVGREGVGGQRGRRCRGVSS
jgi:hypothetical protein